MQAIAFNEFMSGEYKVKEKKKREATLRKAQETMEKIARIGAGMAFPLFLGIPVGISLVTGVTKAFASNTIPTSTPIAVEATAKEWMSEQTLSTLAHVLDPVVDILVALSFPIASVIIVGSCFQFMFDRADKGWTMIQNAGLGYVLIQVSPLILDVLKQVGNAV